MGGKEIGVAHRDQKVAAATRTNTSRRVGLKTADHRRPHRKTLQDAENNFISFQTWFHVKIKH